MSLLQIVLDKHGTAFFVFACILVLSIRSCVLHWRCRDACIDGCECGNTGQDHD